MSADTDTRCPGCRHIPADLHAKLARSFPGDATLHRNAVLPVPDPDDAASIHRHAEAQLTIVMDEMIALAVENARAGRGRSLREAGFTRLADVLGLS